MHGDEEARIGQGETETEMEEGEEATDQDAAGKEDKNESSEPAS